MEREGKEEYDYLTVQRGKRDDKGWSILLGSSPLLEE